jgi:nucleoside-diphosphate-sugar epimerase
LTVNILTAQAYSCGTITVFGGTQMRPNLHLLDMVDVYMLILEAPQEAIRGQIFNAGFENYSLTDTAEIVRNELAIALPGSADIAIKTTSSDDCRSYRLNSDKIAKVLGYRPRRTIVDGIRDLLRAFRNSLLPNAMVDPRYYNVKWMKQPQILQLFDRAG